MKYNRVISTAVLFLVLGTTLPSFAQKAEEGKGEEKAPQAQQKAQPQHAQPAKAQPQHAQAQPQHAQPAQPAKAQPQHAQAQPQRAQPTKAQPQTVASNRGGGNYGRISNANYSAHFGNGHSFRMGRPQLSGGYNRFQYGGYSFGYNQGWPSGWGYDDNFYVVYLNGAYFLCDLRFPGVELTLNIF